MVAEKKAQGIKQGPVNRRYRGRVDAAPRRSDWHQMSPTQQLQHRKRIAARLSENARRSQASRGVLEKLREERKAEHKVTKHRWSEIETRCKMVYEFEQMRPRDAAVENRIAQIKRIHTDLWKVGYRIEIVDKLKEEHIGKLLAYWRENLARSTVKLLWFALAWWSEHALGKGRNMVKPFREVWPPETAAQATDNLAAMDMPTGDDWEAESSGLPSRPVEDDARMQEQLSRPGGAKRGRKPKNQIEQDRPEVLAHLRQIDDRAGWIYELRTTFGLTFNEARQLIPFPGIGLFMERGFLLTHAGKGRQGRIVEFKSSAHADLAKRLVAAGLQWGRQTVGWREMHEMQALNYYNYRLTLARQRAAGQTGLQPERSNRHPS